MIPSKTTIVEQNEYGATVRMHFEALGSFIVEAYVNTEDSTIDEEIKALNKAICSGVTLKEVFESKFYTETQLAMSKANSNDNEVFEYMLMSLSSDVKIYGRGQIPWQVFARLADFEYDDGYGCQEFGGWITFNNTDAFIQRAEYDGSEWWEVVTRPKLKDF